MRPRRPLLLSAAALMLGWAALPAPAATLDLAFLPPAVEPQELCVPGPGDDKADALSAGTDGALLTEQMRLTYLARDIRNLSATDPEGRFDFIETLIGWRARLDPGFAGVEEMLARIRLHVDAGRLQALQETGLIDRLRAQPDLLTGAQRMELAQYYLNGIGVAADRGLALGMMRDAAYDGDPDALLGIARMLLRGDAVPGWDAALDVTVLLGFGGLLGQMNPQICRRAERIALEYLEGGLVTPNRDIAYAWYRFAADLGGAEAAWRIVEFHLSADPAASDNDEMLHYLRLAARRGIALTEGQARRIRETGRADEATLRRILGFNHSDGTGRAQRSIAPWLQLSVDLDEIEAADSSPYMEYLREVIQLGNAPGTVFADLAQEVLARRGRWAGEAEALALLEEAVRRDDPEAMRLLAGMLVRRRDDAAQIERAAALLTEAVEQFGLAAAMQDLDALWRCKVVDAPRLAEAAPWARGWQAAQQAGVDIGATDLISLDPYRKPEMLAQMQAQALDGRTASLANYVQRVQLDPWATERARRMWAQRLDNSDKALELFAELEFDLATNPAERALALELFRRVYLNNGVTTALDLAVALTEDDGRDPAIADEILTLLTQAGNRGEGAAIRLKARLTGDEAGTFREFQDEIEKRGDFLALMFAMPWIGADKVDDYFDRAVSVMNCGTKDADELGDAHAALRNASLSYHWRRVGLTVHGGHVLAKLRLTDMQSALFRAGPAASATEVAQRELAEGDFTAHRSLFALTADPDLPGHDPQAAAGHLMALLDQGGPDDRDWVLSRFRAAPPALRALVEARADMAALYRDAAERGDAGAALDLALYLRADATDAGDLARSAEWLNRAALAGNVRAMTELGDILATGLGVPRDIAAALDWLDKAARAGDAGAGARARLLRIGSAR